MKMSEYGNATAIYNINNNQDNAFFDIRVESFDFNAVSAIFFDSESFFTV